MPMTILRAGMCAAALALLSLAAPAGAQSKGTTTYAVTYMQVADDCEGKGMSMSKGEVSVITSGQGKVRLELAGVPPLEGNQAEKRGMSRFKAQAAAPTKKTGISGRYSASGRVGKGKLQMVFIAEFYRGKKPLCTQSWSAQGTRS